MKKSMLILAVIAFLTTGVFAQTVMPKGSMMQAYPRKPVSTELNQEGDIVYFTNPVDVFSVEEKVFPRNTLFIGTIDFLKMPVQGIDGAFRVKITEALLPDGTIKQMRATLKYKNNKTIGGGLAPPASYNQTVHKTRGWVGDSGTLQWVPSGEYQFGRHSGLTTRDAVMIVLDEDFMVE